MEVLAIEVFESKKNGLHLVIFDYTDYIFL